MLMKDIPLVAFDFDGTLCKGDSILPFLHYAVRQGIAPVTQYFQAGYGYIGQLVHTNQVIRAKEHTLSFIKGWNTDALSSFCCAFVQEYLLPRVYEAGINEMLKLKKEQYTIVIVSASPDIYMKHFLSLLPVDAVIATECEEIDHIYTGHILQNCRGYEKVTRLRNYLNISPDETFSIAKAFGDSEHDIPLLSIAKKGYWVNASQHLVKTHPDFENIRWR